MGKQDSGFTLIELLVAMVIGLVVLGAVYTVFTLHDREAQRQEQVLEMQQSARSAMEMMTREIRMAGFNQTSAACSSPATAVRRCTGSTTAANPPCVGITYAGAGAIGFAADLNSNCDTTPGTANPDENITFDTYVLNGVKVIGRTSNGARQPAVDHVDSLSFTYYDGSGSETANVANIRKIKIRLTVRTGKIDPGYTDPTAGDQHRRYMLESSVILRNMGS